MVMCRLRSDLSRDVKDGRKMVMYRLRSDLFLGAGGRWRCVGCGQIKSEDDGTDQAVLGAQQCNVVKETVNRFPNSNYGHRSHNQ